MDSSHSMFSSRPRVGRRIRAVVAAVSLAVVGVSGARVDAHTLTDPLCPTQPSSSLALKLYWHPGREDNFTAITDQGVQDALNAGYFCARIEGYAFPSSRPGVVPLYTYWNGARGDNFTASTYQAQVDAFNAGYTRVRIEGYVFPTSQPGTVPLKLFWHPGRGDNFTTATPQGEADAYAAGYSFVRIEGYVSMFPTYLDIHHHSNLGAGHFMATQGALDQAAGIIKADTTTQTITLFGGFKGAVRIVLEDASGIAIASSSTYVYGVDGTLIGQSYRQDSFQEAVDPAVANLTAAVHVFHWWAPNNSIESLVDTAVANGEKLADLFAKVKAAGGDGK